MPELNSLANQFFDRREAMRPTARTWVKHIALLLVAFFTVTIAGVLEPFGFIKIFPDADPQTWTEIFQFLLLLPVHYFYLISHTIYRLFTEYETLKYGVSFSASLLTILTAHEAGHYVACRLYRVDATLPYFIPLPPMIGPAGTLGAFIKIVSPMPSRRATFDIGIAGPIAGFLALIPVAIIGLLLMEQVPPEKVSAAEIGLHFSNPLLTQFLAWFVGVNLSSDYFNPFLAAAWIGLLVTSLNLIPSGQLDGGHAVYAVFGERIHRWTGRIAFVLMSLISVSGWYLYSSPSGFLFAILLAVMMRVRHPEPLDNTPLNSTRKLIALLTLLIFILSFVPFPIQIG
ncbi:MAG: site-2 protease family protein [Acidobacteria bacterium]|nr:site-2 protease family protein [Acidobacteriota bacterium]MCA1639853.1 site-2 protease family protein [Acidobacteriota bacterium]